MKECLDKLRHPPVSTQTQIVMNDHMDYPAVTFCFKNLVDQGYDLRILRVLHIQAICQYSVYSILFGCSEFSYGKRFDFGKLPNTSECRLHKSTQCISLCVFFSNSTTTSPSTGSTLTPARTTTRPGAPSHGARTRSPTSGPTPPTGRVAKMLKYHKRPRQKRLCLMTCGCMKTGFKYR